MTLLRFARLAMLALAACGGKQATPAKAGAASLSHASGSIPALIAGQASTPYDVTGTALLQVDPETKEAAIVLLSTDTELAPSCEQLAKPGAMEGADKLTMVAFALSGFKPAAGKYAISSVTLVKAAKGAETKVAANQSLGLTLDVQSYDAGVLTGTLGGKGDATATGNLVARACPMVHKANEGGGSVTTESESETTTTTTTATTTEPEPGATIGAVAPSLEGTTLTGKKAAVSLAALRGKVVLVTFWATSSDSSAKLLPKLQAMSAKYKDRGLVVVGVSKDANATGIEAFAKTAGVSFPLVWDDGKIIVGKWRPKETPATYLIDRKGVVRRIHPGYYDRDENYLDGEVKKLL